jgi:hypothetical protein
VVVMLRNLVERRKCQRVCRRQRDYISGGSSSDGASRGCGSLPPKHRTASTIAWASRTEVLHCRCLASNRFASGGGAVALSANSASSSSRLIRTRRGMIQPFEPMAREKV